MRKPIVAAVLVLSMFLLPGFASAMDDDPIPELEQKPQQTSDDDVDDDSQAVTEEKVVEEGERPIRIGLFMVRQTVEAEKRSSARIVPMIDEQLREAIGYINAKPYELILHEDLLRDFNRRDRYIYNKCWVETGCTSKLLKKQNIDIAVVGKMRARALEAGQDLGRNYLEFSLLVRIIDIKRERVMKEFLVVESQDRALAGSAYKKTYSALEKLGLIIERRQDDAAAVATGADAQEEIVFVPPPVVERRDMGMTIAKYTTLSTGIVAAGLGGLFLGLASNASDDQKNARDAGALNDAKDKQDTYMITSYVMFGVGGGLLISSIVLFVLDAEEAESGSGGDDWSGYIAPTPGGAYANLKFRF